MEGVMAVVTCFAADFAPKYWAYCNGQTLAIAQNQALFSLLGTTFGGNGVTTFQLPNLQSRCAVGTGNGLGLTPITLGQVAGTEGVVLQVNNMPSHAHSGNYSARMNGDASPAQQAEADFAFPAVLANTYSTTQNANMLPFNTAANITAVIGNNAGGQPLSLRTPYLGMNFIICLQGIFPSRN
jgi:microcystin-dependent protein